MHCFQMYEICKTRFGKITIGKKDNKNTFFVRDDMLKVSSSKCQDKTYVLKLLTRRILFFSDHYIGDLLKTKY